jgi:hypothetical protein
MLLQPAIPFPRCIGDNADALGRELHPRRSPVSRVVVQNLSLRFRALSIQPPAPNKGSLDTAKELDLILADARMEVPLLNVLQPFRLVHFKKLAYRANELILILAKIFVQQDQNILGA